MNNMNNGLVVSGASKGLVYDFGKPKGIYLAISNESTPGRVAAHVDPYGFVDWSINNNNNRVLATQLMEWVIGDSKPPATPIGFKVSNGKVGNQLNLTWKANTEKDLNTYYVYRRTASGQFDVNAPIAKVSSNDTIYRDKGLEDGTQYFYVISAGDEVPNLSPFSVERSGTPTDIIAPRTPMNFTVSDLGTGFGLNITWNPNTESDVVEYHIYKSSSIDGPFIEPTFILTPDKTNYMDPDITEGVVSYYRLSAIDEVPNESYLTEIRSGIPYDRIAPAMPKNLNVTNPGVGNTLVLTWDHNSEPDLVDYLIERKNYKGDIKRFTVPAGTNTFTNINLVDGKEYSYKLIARDDTKLSAPNKSPSTAWVKNTPTDFTPPAAPSNFTIIDESYSNIAEFIQVLNLTWKIGNESDLRGYKVYKFDVPKFTPTEDQFLVDVGYTNHYLDYDVKEGEKFYYKITAYDEIPNESDPSIELTGNPKDVTPPMVPDGFKAIPLPEGNTVQLNWNLQYNSDIIGFRLFYNSNQSEDFEWIADFNKSDDEFIHEDLIDDHQYFYKLQAFDNMPNYSPFTAVISVTPSDIMPPEPPRGLRILPLDSGNSLKLSWQPNEEDEDLNGYRIYRRTEDLPFTMVMAVDKNTTEVIDTYLIDDKKYKYYITALDEVPNESDGSVEKDGMPKDIIVPSPASGLTVSVSEASNRPVLSWTKSNSTDVEYYRIFRSVDGKTFKKLIDVPFTQDTYTDLDTETGTKYYYQLSALDEVPNISPRTESKSIKVPTQETSLDSSMITSIIVVIIVIILLFVFMVGIKRRSGKKSETGDSEQEDKDKSDKSDETKPQLPLAQPQMVFPGTGVGMGMGMSMSMGTTQSQASGQVSQPIRPVSPVLPSQSIEGSEQLSKESILPSSDQSGSSIPSLPPATSSTSTTEEEEPGIVGTTGSELDEISRSMAETDTNVEPGGELDGSMESEFDPAESNISPVDTSNYPEDIDNYSQTPMSTAPNHVQSVTPVNIAPPPPQLPTILIPIDDDEKEAGEDTTKKEPLTFTNPELYNVRQLPLRKPPVAQTMSPEAFRKQQEQYLKYKQRVEQQKQLRDQQQKSTSTKISNKEMLNQIKKQKPPDSQPQKKTKKPAKKDKESKENSDDDIKKLLEQYMK
jgi:hypothetical protein